MVQAICIRINGIIILATCMSSPCTSLFSRYHVFLRMYHSGLSPWSCCAAFEPDGSTMYSGLRSCTRMSMDVER